VTTADLKQQHHWLQKFVGEWTYEHDAPPAPDGSPQKFKGTESVRAIGGFWVLGEHHMMMMDPPMTGILTDRFRRATYSA